MTFQDTAGGLGAPGTGSNQGQWQDGDAAASEGEDNQGGTKALQKQLTDWIASKNIADDLDDETLAEIGQRVKLEYDIDDRSRADWKQKIQAALELALQDTKEKQYPWPKAANVIFPLMTTASMQFAARAYPAIVAGRDVVKGIVVGQDSGIPIIGADKQPLVDQQSGQIMWQQPPGFEQMRADRIANHMSWQLLDEMPEWEPETDTLLHQLPIEGSVFRKSYFDPSKGRNVSLTVSALKVVINYYAKGMETAPRISEEIEYYPLEIKEMEMAGIWRKVEYTNEQNAGDDRDAPRHFIEQHRYWDLDEDDYPEPYIITVHKETCQVVRIRARYDEDGVFFDQKTHKVRKIDAIHYYTKYDFLPNPDGGIYGLGFGTLLKPINEAVNTTLNQLIDAGHLQIVGGGFIGRGLSMSTGAVRFAPGEYKAVNVPGATIKDNIVPLNFPGPSAVLFQLLGLLIDAGKDIAAVKDVLTGEQQQHNVPATTTLALIEQGLKVFTGIYKRVHRSLKEELNKLYRLNRIYLERDVNYRAGNAWKNVTREDYAKGGGVEPISDPTMITDMQKLGQAQWLQQFMQDPFCDGLKIRQRMFAAARIDKPDEILHQPPPNPGMMMKMHEMQVKTTREKAAELKDLANAILMFAQADKVVGDMHIDWTQSKLAAWQAQFEAAAGGGQPGAEGAPPTPSPIPHPPGPAPGPSGLHPGAAPEVMPGLSRGPNGGLGIPGVAQTGPQIAHAQ